MKLEIPDSMVYVGTGIVINKVFRNMSSDNKKYIAIRILNGFITNQKLKN